MRTRRMRSAALILLLLSLLASPDLTAQDKKISKKEVPAAVLSAFAGAYPHAKIKGTSTEVEKGTTYYEIESLDGTQARDLLYLPDGTVAEIEEIVAAGTLPAPVSAAVGSEFAKAKIMKAEKVTKGTVVSYEVHVELGAKRGSVVLSPSGTVLEKIPLKMKKKAEEKEEEDD